MDIRERLAAATLYLCTDARRETGDLAEFADAALAGGVDVIQLRDKGSEGERRFGPLEARQELEALAVLRAACDRHGALLSVNDRADIAAAAGVDVLHLGQDDLPLEHARALLGDGVLIGRSTHDPEQTRQAAAETGLDYFSVGPCWATPTKPGRTPAGLDLVRVAAEVAGDRPFYPIGGIDVDRLPEVLAAGASRVAVVRAINGAADPRAAAAELKAALVSA
ncbi:thiamine phosphate synthase [Saccharopolyspora taberi]|uniref:thiamine phosphate synthase n=1 Tax=Saccharopolyspora taberi TaxID=60895 RepID=UPI0031D22EE4